MECVLLAYLVPFTWHDYFEIHPCYCVCQYFFPFFLSTVLLYSSIKIYKYTLLLSYFPIELFPLRLFQIKIKWILLYISLYSYFSCINAYLLNMNSISCIIRVLSIISINTMYFWSSIRLTVKFKRRYRNSPYIPCSHPHTHA